MEAMPYSKGKGKGRCDDHERAQGIQPQYEINAGSAEDGDLFEEVASGWKSAVLLNCDQFLKYFTPNLALPLPQAVLPPIYVDGHLFRFELACFYKDSANLASGQSVRFNHFYDGCSSSREGVAVELLHRFYARNGDSDWFGVTPVKDQYDGDSVPLDGVRTSFLTPKAKWKAAVVLPDLVGKATQLKIDYKVIVTIQRTRPPTTLPSAPVGVGKGMRQLYGNPKFEDVTFSFDGGVKMGANKTILACRSPVFAAMFQSDLHDASKPITIADVDPVVFKTFLRFLYGLSVDCCDESSAGTVCHLIGLADKYDCRDLFSHLQAVVTYTFNSENIGDYLRAADLYSLHSLFLSCAKWLFDDAHPARHQKAHEATSFQNLPPAILLKLLATSKGIPLIKADSAKVIVRDVE